MEDAADSHDPNLTHLHLTVSYLMHSFISPVNNCIAFCFKNTEIDHKDKHFNLISFRHITEDIA